MLYRHCAFSVWHTPTMTSELQYKSQGMRANMTDQVHQAAARVRAMLTVQLPDKRVRFQTGFGVCLRKWILCTLMNASVHSIAPSNIPRTPWRLLQHLMYSTHSAAWTAVAATCCQFPNALLTLKNPILCLGLRQHMACKVLLLTSHLTSAFTTFHTSLQFVQAADTLDNCWTAYAEGCHQ